MRYAENKTENKEINKRNFFNTRELLKNKIKAAVITKVKKSKPKISFFMPNIELHLLFITALQSLFSGQISLSLFLRL